MQKRGGVQSAWNLGLKNRGGITMEPVRFLSVMRLIGPQPLPVCTNPTITPDRFEIRDNKERQNYGTHSVQPRLFG
jgi:hypothetical protein